MSEYKFFSSDGATNGLLTDDAFAEVGANGVVITNISDGAVVSEASLNKMATSIPTPFARLYLYDTAFAELNTIEGIDVNKGTAYRSEPGSATLYHHLVSECLDMLEFIFEYGNDPRLSIEEWDAVEDTNLIIKPQAPKNAPNFGQHLNAVNVTNETDEKHTRLGIALRDAVLNTNLSKTPKIFIFKWEQNGIKTIIGGTSPYTLVYTNPNWRRNKTENFVGGLGNPLFPPISKTTKVYSLAERSDRFRKYIYELHQIYDPQFSLAVANGGTMLNLNTYILNNINNYEQGPSWKSDVITEHLAIAPSLSIDNLRKEYEPLKLTSSEDSTDERPIISTNANVRGILFFTKKNLPDTGSDYMIKPTVADAKLPVETLTNGAKMTIADHKPLVLSKTALNGGAASYWHGTPYNPQSLPAREDNKYFERGLPGVPGNPPYPYLTESDILEDKIMWLGYKIDKTNFFTGFNGDSGFLLPLKPNFFKFFTVEDLPRMVKIDCDPFLAGSPTVTVTVRIPVKGGEVVFSRKYESSKDHYIDFESAESFKVGIFPFYTYTGEDANENIYKVLLARKGDLSLEFYNEDFVAPLGNDVVSTRIRTSNATGTTEYYTVGTPFNTDGGATPDMPGTFTALRVVKGNHGGFIIPLFKKVKSGTDKYVFCVDFGTANTNVAYAKTSSTMTPAGNPVDRVSGADIRTLDYTAEEAQMAMLNEKGSEGGADDLNQCINSEFIPEAIGVGEVKFPIRTLACGRKDKVAGKYELFGDLNISFQSDRYGNIDDYSYYSELKWGRAAALASMNISFFEELMWIIKNKVAQLGGNKDFAFYFTYPQTMSNVQTMSDGWLEARNDVRAGHGLTFNLQMRSANNMRLNIFEGIAPWYRAISLPNAGIFHTDNFLNIDIGGGSTDAIYICRPRDGQTDNRVMQGYSFSAKFAANDLWGDGIIGTGGKLNGYVNYFEKNILPNLAQTQQQSYTDYSSRAQASADIISYLFSRKHYGFANSLAADDKLKIPMLIHFAATIYYVGRTLAYQQLAIPRHIRFSGMGSLYIKYLSSNPDEISDLIKAIFNHAGLKTDGKEIDASFATEPKKITAEGGVLMHNTTINGLTDKVVRSSELNNYLYDGEDEEEEAVDITCGTLDKYSDATVREAAKFIEIFKKQDFKNVLLKIFQPFPYVDLNEINSTFATGFDLGKSFEYADSPEHQPVKDVLFFWPVKHAIHQLALSLAAEVSQKNQH